MKLKPLGDRLIVKAVEEEETTASGIVLPDTAKEKPQKGKVVAVGDGKWDEEGEKRIPLDGAAGGGGPPSEEGRGRGGGRRQVGRRGREAHPARRRRGRRGPLLEVRRDRDQDRRRGPPGP